MAFVKNNMAFVASVLNAKSLDSCNVARLADVVAARVKKVVDTSKEALVAARAMFANTRLNCSVISRAEFPKASAKFVALTSITASIAANAVLKSVGSISVLSVNMVLIAAIDVINDVPTDTAVALKAAVALSAV